MSATTYSVVKHNPFTVRYQDNLGNSKDVSYSVPLLPAEIKAEMPYIIFHEDEIDPDFLYSSDDDDDRYNTLTI